jgi:hypothetical protein
LEADNQGDNAMPIASKKGEVEQIQYFRPAHWANAFTQYIPVPLSLILAFDTCIGTNLSAAEPWREW